MQVIISFPPLPLPLPLLPPFLSPLPLPLPLSSPSPSSSSFPLPSPLSLFLFLLLSSPLSLSPLPTAEDLVQERVSQMQENLEASRGGSSHLSPNHLNLFYSYSLSCPLLVENDESGTLFLLYMMYTHVMYMYMYVHMYMYILHGHVCLWCSLRYCSAWFGFLCVL